MISGILELASRTTYGITSKNVPLYLFRPLNTKLSACIVGCSNTTYKTNVLALVEVPEWSNRHITRGLLNRILGPCGDFEAEQEALVYQYSNTTWKKNLKFNIPSMEDRELIQGVSFNIDPNQCVDIDDVFTIGDDGYYYITIADVSEWMKMNPTMYGLAHENGQTLYNNGKVVRPMIPFQTECSLNLQTYRLGVSMRFQIVDDEISGISFKKTLIVNTKSYTYNSIQTSTYASILQWITKILTKKDTVNSYDWVEALMIFYNTEAAKILQNAGQGILRIHEQHDVEKFEKYKRFGVSTEFLAMKSAKYVSASTLNTYHYGLQTDIYCHATSPIRRFADIVNQYVLKGEDAPDYDIETLNERSIEIKKYNRDSFFLNQLRYTVNRCVCGIVLNDHRVWIPDWKRIVTCRNDFPEGTKGTVYFSLDMTQSTWKKRMVFRFTDTTYLD